MASQEKILDDTKSHEETTWGYSVDDGVVDWLNLGTERNGDTRPPQHKHLRDGIVFYKPLGG